MIDEIATEAQAEMDKVIEALKKQLASIRAGRANTMMLDGIRLDYYGDRVPLSQVASLQVVDASLITVKPWEKGIVKDIEKAIVEAQIGLNPNSDGELVRVPIPPLTEERRKEYAKQSKVKAEDAKVAIRNARRDANDMLKAAMKDGDISEDDEKRGLKVIQDHTDAFVKVIDDLHTKKEAEILQV